MTTEIVEEPTVSVPLALILRLVTAETVDVCVANAEEVTLPTFAETETVERLDMSCPFSTGTSFSATPDTVEETPAGVPLALLVLTEIPDAVEVTPRTPEPLLVRSVVATTRLDCASREPFAVGKRVHPY